MLSFLKLQKLMEESGYMPSTGLNSEKHTIREVLKNALSTYRNKPFELGNSLHWVADFASKNGVKEILPLIHQMQMTTTQFYNDIRGLLKPQRTAFGSIRSIAPGQDDPDYNHYQNIYLHHIENMWRLFTQIENKLHGQETSRNA